MSIGYKINEDDSAYYITFQIVGWVNLFIRQAYRVIAIDSFKFCQKNKNLKIICIQAPETMLALNRLWKLNY